MSRQRAVFSREWQRWASPESAILLDPKGKTRKGGQPAGKSRTHPRAVKRTDVRVPHEGNRPCVLLSPGSLSDEAAGERPGTGVLGVGTGEVSSASTPFNSAL